MIDVFSDLLVVLLLLYNSFQMIIHHSMMILEYQIFFYFFLQIFASSHTGMKERKNESEREINNLVICTHACFDNDNDGGGHIIINTGLFVVNFNSFKILMMVCLSC